MLPKCQISYFLISQWYSSVELGITQYYNLGKTQQAVSQDNDLTYVHLHFVSSPPTLHTDSTAWSIWWAGLVPCRLLMPPSSGLCDFLESHGRLVQTYSVRLAVLWFLVNTPLDFHSTSVLWQDLRRRNWTKIGCTAPRTHIRKEGNWSMNGDEGSYQLSHAYDRFLDVMVDRHIKIRKNWVPASSGEGLMMRPKCQGN